ncbi:PBP1A family penicillin-binding protein [Natranaerobius thermophilus]|uniref:transglycosylase domain-containing protein n=1 Tax=Natranaerobius thermophilus TaxID=375929 RepID=UPI002F4181C4
MLIILFLGGGTAFGMVVAALQTVPEFEPGQLEATVPSKIKDPDGNEIVRLDREHQREEVSLDQVPDHVIEAFIAIEDARFEEHFGFDVRGISRAAVNNFQETGNPFKGSQGGSTITQQLVKNTFLSPKRLLERKIHEAWLALHVERTYTKEEIMEYYLNYATYFHHNIYGIQAASNFYFDKDVSDLDVEEGALLAGIIRHPSRLSPHNNPDHSKQRQETVLHSMKSQDFISESEFNKALNKELDEILASKPEKQYPYPHFIDYVINEEAKPILEDKIGSVESLPDNVQNAEDLLYHHGLTIHTTIDRELQSYSEDIMDNPENYPETWEDEMGVLQPQGALVVSDPNTGEVRAMVGGRDYGTHNMVNRVTSTRSPGSAMKPINVYAPAIEEGKLTPGTVIDDAPSSWEDGGDSYEPENFTNTFRGLTTVREALVDSLNIPAVRVYDDRLGTEIGAEYAEKFGVTTFTEGDRHNLAASIGGLTKGVKPLELTEAYGTLANNGIRVENHTITKIEDRYGNTIYEREPDYDVVISEETSWLITDILQDVVTEGTAASLNLNFPAAAKTGTSNNFRDAWLVGYTPNLVASFWLGYDYDDIQVQNRTHFTTNIIENVMTHALKDENPPEFQKPDGIEGPIEISEKSGMRASDKTPSEYTTYEFFPEDQIPTGECDIFVEKKSLHCP